MATKSPAAHKLRASPSCRSIRARSKIVAQSLPQQSNRTCRDFAHAWAGGMCGGPTELVMGILRKVCDPNIHIRVAHPLSSTSILQGLLEASQEPVTASWCSIHQGLDGLQAKLARDRQVWAGDGGQTQSDLQPEVVLVAVNDTGNTAFCLVRLPGTLAVPETYTILKLGILLDDSSLHVTSVLERSQLHAFTAATHQGGQRTGAQQAAGSQGGPQTATSRATTPFPRELVKPWPNWRGFFSAGKVAVEPGRVQRVEAGILAWIRAREDRTDVQKMMELAGCDQDFQLIDAYGRFPVLSQPTTITPIERLQADLGTGGAPGGAGTGLATGSALSQKATEEVLKALKEVFEVECQLVDAAVCLEEAAAFAHWKAKMRNRITGVYWDLEGMEVDLLDPSTGNLRAVYLFSDGMEFDELRLGR